MSHVAVSALAASFLLLVAISIAIVPVEKIIQLNKKLRQRFGAKFTLTQALQTSEPAATTARKPITNIMRTYLHQRNVREHVKLAAAAQNIHPINEEDILAQIVYLRRDLTHIAQLLQVKTYPAGSSPLKMHGSEFSIAMDELVASPEIRLVGIRYFTYHVDLRSPERVVPFARRNIPISRAGSAR